jgi:probable rRNA maturation factor
MRLLLSRHKGCSKSKIPWLDARTIGRLAAAANSLPPEDGEIGLVVADDAYVRELNRTYRGMDRPTDVISFSYAGDPRQPTRDHDTAGGDDTADDDVAGEVYLSFETIEARARARGVPPEHLFLRAAVHGLLHVVGHVHETDPEADRMETEERRLLLQQLTPPEVEELF